MTRPLPDDPAGPPAAKQQTNEFGQPIGDPLPSWSAPPLPPCEVIEGRYCRLEPLDPELHATDLHLANSLDAEGRNWTYLPVGPFNSLETYRAWMTDCCLGKDPMFYAIVERGSGSGSKGFFARRRFTRRGRGIRRGIRS